MEGWTDLIIAVKRREYAVNFFNVVLSVTDAKVNKIKNYAHGNPYCRILTTIFT